MIRFSNKVLILGFGAVARSFLPLLMKHVRVPHRNITVIDFIDQRRSLREWLVRGVRFYRERITPQNLTKILSRHVNAGGMIVDLAWNIDCLDILSWTLNNRVLYVNASIEEWDPYAEIHTRTSLEKSLYRRYVRILELLPRWRGATTAVLDHGVNPGLITHLTKRGLIDITRRLIGEGRISHRRDSRVLESLIREQDFAALARKLGVKVIHCSERDTQLTNRSKATDEFVGSWSIEGMIEEAISPVEIGWGTHERRLPERAIVPDTGPRNQIILPQMGINTWIRSWAPDQEFVGMIIPHGEAFSISRMLTVSKGKRTVYRPTVCYSYLPSDETIASLHDLRCRGYELPPRKRIMANDITTGSDTLGALIMGHPYGSWWIGSRLSIEEARRLVPGSNATTVQVAVGVLAAVLWMFENPRAGLCFPEDLPYAHILRIARPYLGDFISRPVDWTPLTNYQVFFIENPADQPDKSDPWQFQNFTFKP